MTGPHRAGDTGRLSQLVALFRAAGGAAPNARQQRLVVDGRAIWQDELGRWWSGPAAQSAVADAAVVDPPDALLAELGLSRVGPPPQGTLCAVWGDGRALGPLALGFAALAGRAWRRSVRTIQAGDAPSWPPESPPRGEPRWAPPRCDVLVVTGVAEWLDDARVGHVYEAAQAGPQAVTLLFGGPAGRGDAWRRLDGLLRDRGARASWGGQQDRHPGQDGRGRHGW